MMRLWMRLSSLHGTISPWQARCWAFLPLLQRLCVRLLPSLWSGCKRQSQTRTRMNLRTALLKSSRLLCFTQWAYRIVAFLVLQLQQTLSTCTVYSAFDFVLCLLNWWFISCLTQSTADFSVYDCCAVSRQQPHPHINILCKITTLSGVVPGICQAQTQ